MYTSEAVIECRGLNVLVVQLKCDDEISLYWSVLLLHNSIDMAWQLLACSLRNNL